MEHLTLPVTRQISRYKKSRRLIGRIVIVLAAVGLVLAFDFSPAVPDVATPTAEQALRVRSVADQLRMQLSQRNGFASVRFDSADLASLAALGSALKKFGRIDSRIAQQSVIVRVSYKFGFIWANGEARIATNAAGFPQTRLKLGNLPLGATTSRWLIDITRHLLRFRGIAVPPLNDLIRSTAIEANSVTVRVNFPLGGAFANDLSNLRSSPVDAANTAQIYCELAKQNRVLPTTDLATLVRRAFAARLSDHSLVEQNRARFVALAMLVSSPSAGRLAGNAAQRVKACVAPADSFKLAGRRDLAMHWTLSAAFTVSLGEDVSRAMGEWKELSDSRPGGSGFSFVDLAADRAGVSHAQRATDPATAAATATTLSRAASEDILPIRALAFSEGLTEQAFVTNFNTTDSTAFYAAKSRIDAVLANRATQ